MKHLPAGTPHIISLSFHRKDNTMKTLQLIFKTEGKTDLTVSLDSPKEDLTLAECQAAAAKLVPILLTRSGVAVTEFKKAIISTTTEAELE